MNRATALVLVGGLGLTALFVVLPSKSIADGRPFVPASPDEVLERVAPGTSVSATPLPAPEAVRRARALIDEARKAGNDPRPLGRAQATLNPWWHDAAPPPGVRLLRATLKQSFHDFEGALVDLDALTTEDPSDAQAWLTRATVLGVLARYDQALASCAKLEPLANDVVLAVCRAPLLAVQGQTTAALASLNAVRPSPAERGWLLSTRGEIERWSGAEAAADATLSEALSLDADDTYTRLLLADLRLDTNRRAEAAQLFAGRVVNDTELLLQVLALDGTPAADAPRADLDARVAANRQRGETLHRREESRFALALEHDAPHALSLAIDNWNLQKEPADARVLLEAAVAAKQPEAAAPVLKWLDATHFEQPRLKALRAELGR